MNWKSLGFILFCSLWVAIFSNFAFAPYSQDYLIWLSPWGLFLLESKYRGRYKKLLGIGALVAVVFYSFSFTWIYHMTTVFGGFPHFLAVPIFFGSAVICNLWFPFFLVFFSFFNLRIRSCFSLGAGFVALAGEFLTPQVFPWYWGSVVAGNEYLAQTAEYASVYGLSFLLFFVSYSVYAWIGKDILLFLWSLPVQIRNPAFLSLNPKNWSRKKNTVNYLIVPLALYLMTFAFGGYLFQKWESYPKKGEIDVVMIQPNGPLEFRDGRSVSETMNDLMNRIEELANLARLESKDPIDLVVLPESGIPFFSAHRHEATVRPNPLYWERMDSLLFLIANHLDTNVFFNEIDASFVAEPKVPRNKRYYNSSTVYDPNGERRSSYQKIYLLIFGEYMPFEFLYELSPQTGRFESGKSLELLPIYSRIPEIDQNTNPSPISEALKKRSLAKQSFPEVRYNETALISKAELDQKYSDWKTPVKEQAKFLPLICYEVIIPEFVRQFRDSGNPDFIVNVTNDKWYGISAETFQHGDLARIRSIEWRKWMVRSTNSGSSFFVDHLGRVVDNRFTGQETSEYYRRKIDLMDTEPTFYVRNGNLIPWSILGISGFFLLGIYIRRELLKK
jgi:apolipoprotein N-acyltransferase